MERIDKLILQSRRDTDNEDFSETTGIPDASFLKWVNRAQKRVQACITGVRPFLFQATKIQTVTAGTDTYAIPAYVLLSTRIEKVEYSVTGLAKDYYELTLIDSHMRSPSGTNGNPIEYIRQSGNIILQPAPGSTGSLRWTFQKTVADLDIRRSKVSASTLSSTQLTALTLDTTMLTDEDIDVMEDSEYITIVDKDGQILMFGIAISSIDSATGIVTLNGSHTFETGETCPAGAYVLAGKRVTTHSELDDVCEEYLSAFMDYKGHRKDSSDDSAEDSSDLKDILTVILESYAEADPNVHGIPVINDEFTDSTW
jgi:hypothetical protein